MISPKLQPIPRAILSCHVPFSEFMAYVQSQTKDSVCQIQPEHYNHILNILLYLAPFNAEARALVYLRLQSDFSRKEALLVETAIKHGLVVLDDEDGYKICSQFDPATCLLALDGVQFWQCIVGYIVEVAVRDGIRENWYN